MPNKDTFFFKCSVYPHRRDKYLVGIFIDVIPIFSSMFEQISNIFTTLNRTFLVGWF